MRRLSFLSLVLVTSLFGTGLFGTVKGNEPSSPSKHKRLNVVLIVTDDLGYGDLGFQGCKDIPTPRLDALAASGVRFTNAYVTGCICGPTRAGLFSGRYQQRHSYDGNPGPNQGLNLEEKTLADAFHAGGYRTMAIGKWHLGQNAEYRPLKRGFDEFFGFYGARHSYVPGAIAPEARMRFEKPRRVAATDVTPASTGAGARPAGTFAGNGGEGGSSAFEGAAPGKIIRGDAEVDEPEYLTDAFAREAVDFVGRNAERPFFLYVAFNASHSPLQPPNRFLEKFAHLEGKRKAYAATTAALDEAVGRVVDKVRELDLEENTLFYYTNDNGGPIEDIAANNTPLSGAKFSLWEGGIRVPSFVSWKGRLAAGKTIDAPVISLDIFPTLVAAAGLQAPEGKNLEGVSLLSVLEGGTSEAIQSRPLFWRNNQFWAIREQQWKLTLPERGENVQLFDLSTDVAEDRDLSAEHPEIVERLKATWDRWNKQNLPIAQRNVARERQPQ